MDKEETKQKKILVVEDDNFLANIIRVKLTKRGFTVVLAFDGNEAMAKLKDFTPDLILLDLILPKKDGFSVLEEIKATREWRNIPVLIASNLGQQEDIDRCLSLGANDYFVKTEVSLENIIEKINSLIKSPASRNK